MSRLILITAAALSSFALFFSAGGCAHRQVPPADEIHVSELALQVNVARTRIRECEPVTAVIRQRNLSPRSLLSEWGFDGTSIGVVDCATGKRYINVFFTYQPEEEGGFPRCLFRDPRCLGPYGSLADTATGGFLPPGRYRLVTSIPALKLAAVSPETLMVDSLRQRNIAEMMGRQDTLLFLVLVSMRVTDEAEFERLLSHVNDADSLWFPEQMLRFSSKKPATTDK